VNEAVNQEIRIRPMAEADTEAAKSIAAGLADAPHWDAKAYAAAIARAGAQQGIALVAEDALGCLAGFIVGGLIPPEAEIESVVVRSASQRQGIAGRLLVAFTHEAKLLGCNLILLEVRPSNLAARAFYEASGFAETARRPAYYANPIEDAILMARTLP
jgi:ribosomal-protein-alanine acetyltransferase